MYRFWLLSVIISYYGLPFMALKLYLDSFPSLLLSVVILTSAFCHILFMYNQGYASVFADCLWKKCVLAQIRTNTASLQRSQGGRSKLKDFGSSFNLFIGNVM